MKLAQNLFQEWLKTRPPEIQALCAEFPLGTEIPKSLTEAKDDHQWMVIGYGDNDNLVISYLDPTEDYHRSMEVRERIHAQHLRDFNKAEDQT